MRLTEIYSFSQFFDIDWNAVQMLKNFTILCVVRDLIIKSNKTYFSNFKLGFNSFEIPVNVWKEIVFSGIPCQRHKSQSISNLHPLHMAPIKPIKLKLIVELFALILFVIQLETEQFTLIVQKILKNKTRKKNDREKL